jgi:hypothetical protein
MRQSNGGLFLGLEPDQGIKRAKTDQGRQQEHDRNDENAPFPDWSFAGEKQPNRPGGDEKSDQTIEQAHIGFHFSLSLYRGDAPPALNRGDAPPAGK